MKDMILLCIAIAGFIGLVLCLFIPPVGGLIFITSIGLGQMVKNGMRS